MDIIRIYLDAHKNQCKILFTRSKVSLRRFYESFTFNKQCKSCVHNITSSSSNKFHEEHQALFFLTFPRTRKFIVPLRQYKLHVDPCLKDRQARLDINSGQEYLVLMNSFFETDPHWIFENDHRM
jgi:hypothetical protein